MRLIAGAQTGARAVAALHRCRYRASARDRWRGLWLKRKKSSADLLSYSPEQVVETFAERAVMPVVFAELAAQYPLHKVRDENSGIVAANGQYILVRRAAYDAVGGHAAVATEILEDVALARRFREGRPPRLFPLRRRCRPHPHVPELGATPRRLDEESRASISASRSALLHTVCFNGSMAWFAIYIAASGLLTRHFIWILAAALWLLVYRRIRTAHFATVNNLVAIAFGLPLFAYLLLRSKRAHANGQVSWKGRDYDVGRRHDAKASRQAISQSASHN